MLTKACQIAQDQNIRLLSPLQSLALYLDSGIWSGDRRNMEIAEWHRSALVTVSMSRDIRVRLDSVLIIADVEARKTTFCNPRSSP